MISALFISSLAGEVLISRQYKNDIPGNYVETFLGGLKQDLLVPEQECHGMWFYNINRNGLYYVAVSKLKQCPFVMIDALSRFFSILKDFCGTVSEDAVRVNFIMIQELLMEFIELGYVQLSSSEKLKSCIYTEAVLPRGVQPSRRVVHPGLAGSEISEVPSHAANKPTVISRSTRSLHQNEIFLDVIENLSIVINKEGTTLRSEVAGRLTMKNFVSNALSLKLGLNEDLTVGLCNKDAGFGGSVHFDDCNFFDNANLDLWTSNRVITIQANPGEHDVMNYHISSNTLSFLPFRLIYEYEKEQMSHDLDVKLVLRCMLPQTSKALQVVAHLPIPKSTTSVMSRLIGPPQEIEHVLQKKCVIWKIRNFSGSTEATAKLKLIEGNTSPGCFMELGPLALEFELSAFVCSGLKVKFLQLCGQKEFEVEPFRWVRYITYSKSYVFRLV